MSGGTYSRFPTDPISIQPLIESGPTSDDLGAPIHEWEPSSAPAVSTAAQSTPVLAPWALFAAIVSLIASFFVGWGVPLAIIAVVIAVMALRRTDESRSVARWALVLGVLACIYSVGWLLWAAMQFSATA